MVGGIVVAFVVLLGLVFGTMWLYFGLRGFPKCRGIRLNVIFIILIFVVTMIIHFVCLYTVADNNVQGDFLSGMVSGLKEIFSLFGGLTFEGQSLGNEAEAHKVATFFYFLSIAWLAISDAILIVIGVSYSTYSRISLFFRFTSLSHPSSGKHSKRIFIFAYATRESLFLADNIIDSGNGDGKDRKKDIIIFSSDELGPFDKDNEIHNRIANSNYLYIPLRKMHYEKGKYVPLIRRLFRIRTMWGGLPRLLIGNDVYLFALATRGEEMLGYEAKNSDMVFDDMKSFVQHKYFRKYFAPYFEDPRKEKEAERTSDDGIQVPDKEFPCIHYFVLSNHDLNFEFYQRSVSDILSCLGKQWEGYNPLFDLKILNESDMAATDLLYKRHDENEIGYAIDTSDHAINANGIYRTLVVGFGLNSQLATGKLYVDTIGGKLEDGYFYPRPFAADVIDINIDHRLSPFLFSHPCFVAKKGFYVDGDESDTLLAKHILDRYKSQNLFFKDKEEERKFLRLMGFPLIGYQKMDCFSLSFAPLVKDIANRVYDSVIIAIGEDERNIECANMILKCLRQGDLGQQKNVEIYVDIRNPDNQNRLNYVQRLDSLRLHGVHVTHFGSVKDMYSISLLNDKDAIATNKGYCKINREYDTPLEGYEECHWKRQHLKNLDYYRRKSNAFAGFFGKVYASYLHKVDENAFALLQEDYKRFRDFKEVPPESLYVEDTNWNGKVYKSILNLLGKRKTDKDGKPCFDYPRHLNPYIFLLANESRDEKYRYKGGKDYNADYYWRYLMCVEHARWVRHGIIYGMAYVQDYTEHGVTVLPDSFYKAHLRLHNCLLPNSPLPADYTTLEQSEFLSYAKSGNDLTMVIIGLGFQSDK